MLNKSKILIIPAIILLTIPIGYWLTYQPQSYNDEILVALMGLAAFTTYLVMRYKVLKAVKDLRAKAEQVAEGNLTTSTLIPSEDEVGRISQAIDTLRQNILHAREFVKNIEQGDLEATYTGVDEKLVEYEDENTSQLSSSLLRMRKQIKQITEKEKQRNWASEGLTQFVEIFRNNQDNLETLSYDIISNLVKYLNANQGGLFVVDTDEYTKKVSLNLTSAYAYDRRKFLNKVIEPGEGLVGQAYLEKSTIYIDDIPSDYPAITSGLGKAKPKSILITPLKINEEVMGIIEIASLYTLHAYEIEFVEKLGENIAATIGAVKANEKTRVLLEEAQQMTLQMSLQEDELRGIIEEMMKAQEVMKDQELNNIELVSHLSVIQDELDMKLQAEQAQKAKLDAFLRTSIDSIIFLDMDEMISSINEGGEKMFSYSAQELLGEQISHILEIAPTSKNFLDDYKKQSKGKMGIPIEYFGKSKMYGFRFPVEVSLNEASLEGERFYTVFVRNITQRKEIENRMKKSLENFQQLQATLFERETSLRELKIQLSQKSDILKSKEVEIMRLKTMITANPNKKERATEL